MNSWRRPHYRICIIVERILKEKIQIENRSRKHKNRHCRISLLRNKVNIITSEGEPTGQQGNRTSSDSLWRRKKNLCLSISKRKLKDMTVIIGKDKGMKSRKKWQMIVRRCFYWYKNNDLNNDEQYESRINIKKLGTK